MGNKLFFGAASVFAAVLLAAWPLNSLKSDDTTDLTFYPDSGRRIWYDEGPGSSIPRAGVTVDETTIHLYYVIGPDRHMATSPYSDGLTFTKSEDTVTSLEANPAFVIMPEAVDGQTAWRNFKWNEKEFSFPFSQPIWRTTRVCDP